MSARARTPLPPHQPNCLGCGDANPASLGLSLFRVGDRVEGDVTLDSRHEGAPGYAHGGAVATILDDALGSLLQVIRTPAVTARLEIDYRRPALIGRRFDVEAWIDRESGRKLFLRGLLRDGDELIAEAAGLFVEVDPEHFRRGADHSRALPRRPGEPTLPW